MKEDSAADNQTISVGSATQRPHPEFVPFGEKVLARRISDDPLNRINPRYKFGTWLGVRNNSAECYVGTLEGVFRIREVAQKEQKDHWNK